MIKLALFITLVLGAVGTAHIAIASVKPEAAIQHLAIKGIVLENLGGSRYITYEVLVKKANLQTKEFRPDSEVQVVMDAFRRELPLHQLCVLELEMIKSPGGHDWEVVNWRLESAK